MDKWTTHDQLEYRIEEIVQRLFDLTLAMIYDHQSEVEAKKIMTIMIVLKAEDWKKKYEKYE